MADLFIESLATVDELIARLADGHHLKRAEAARELVNRKERAREALPHLVALADDPSWFVRYQVPRAMVHFAAPAEQAIPLLRRLLADGEEAVRSVAAWALRRFGQEDGLPPLQTGPPELVVHGAIPELQGQVCEELIVQELWCQDELADAASAIWMRFTGQWYRLSFDCIVYWEARETGPRAGPWTEPSGYEDRLADLAGPLSLRGVVLERLEAAATSTGAIVRFVFPGGVVLEFEDNLDETVYRLTKPVTNRGHDERG